MSSMKTSMEIKHVRRSPTSRHYVSRVGAMAPIVLVCSWLLTFPPDTYGQSTLRYDPNGNLSNVVAATPGPPILTAPPSSQGAENGDDVSFSVFATGSGPLTYQWFQNGVLIPGATNGALFLSNVAVSNQSYTVSVCNSYGCVTSTVPALLETSWMWIAAGPGDWYNPANWSPAQVPTGQANIVIPAGAIIGFCAPVTVAGALTFSGGAAARGSPL